MTRRAVPNKPYATKAAGYSTELRTKLETLAVGEVLHLKRPADWSRPLFLPLGDAYRLMDKSTYFFRQKSVQDGVEIQRIK